ncbi:MAG TPA: hypothetical protein VEQ87_12140 [Burkholderiales bacterium]|nr:hypothetical protein [Burkholderiales bacterium]
MHSHVRLALLLVLALGASCSHTVVVPVPPRVDLSSYGTLGIVDFASNSERAINSHATRQFQEQVQAAQPGTRFVELGDRQALLAAFGASQLDPDTLRKIGQKYRVNAVFVGDIAYSEPRTEVKIADVQKLEGGMRAEVRGDISSRLLETTGGASIWSSSAWARRQLGSVSVSAERGVSGSVSKSNPRDEMVPALVYHLTQDFRPSAVRQAQ